MTKRGFFHEIQPYEVNKDTVLSWIQQLETMTDQLENLMAFMSSDATDQIISATQYYQKKQVSVVHPQSWT